MNEIKEKYLEELNNGDGIKILQCIKNAESKGLLVEVVYSALNEMKSFPKNTSPLLALQIALDSWDC